MLTLELLLLIASSVYIGFNRLVNKKIDTFYLICLLVIILSVHLIIDGARWQMIPSYTIWLFALITALRQTEQASSLTVRIAKTTGLGFLFTLAIALPTFLPIFQLPKASGPYAVGTTDILIETDREEVITADETDRRRFMVKAWYPSNETGGEQDLYLDRAERSGFAQKYGLPPFILNYLDSVETNVYRNSSLADETFPVLIFSHGYHTKANGYYALLSDIASQGYIIFAINHTYESTGTTFTDGTEVYFDYEYAKKIESNTWETIKPAVEAFDNGLAFEERQPIVQKALTNYFVRDIIERWTQDIVAVVDKVDEWNQSGLFKGKLDNSNVGVFGHSRGGGAAGESLLIDDRIKAGANLDGVQWGQIVKTKFQKPFLYLSSDWPDEHLNLNQHAYVKKSTSVFYEGIILQSGHSNFMDIPYMIPLQSLSQAGDIDPDLAIQIASRIVTAFFDNHLKSEGADINTIDSEYEMLEMNIYKGDSLNTVTN